MGQAKRRGNFEQRKAESSQRYQDALNKRNEELRRIHEARLAEIQSKRPEGFVGPIPARMRKPGMSVAMAAVLAAMFSNR